MDTAITVPGVDEDHTDKCALVMMLSYVAGECHRLGASDAAQHAMVAASILSPSGLAPSAEPRAILPAIPRH